MASHPNKHLREAIKYAEESGWRIVKGGPRSHAWGMMYCQFAGREGCRETINSTPRNPENHAKDLRRAVDQCPH
ncbi:MAG: hypothetical protein O3A00_11720 [Planctomycetota bacterium]|nr:hypothetical protein [Planctomycetota bacterium]